MPTASRARPTRSEAALRHLAIDRGHLFDVGNHRAQIGIGQLRVDLARHHDERRAIAPHAVPDGADPVGVRELSADSAFASRQVLARDHSDRPHFRVQLPAQIRIVTDGACRHGLHEMFSALDCGTIRRNGDRSRRHRVDLAEHALACHEHPNSHTRDGKTYPACHAEEPRSCHSSSLNLLPSFGHACDLAGSPRTSWSATPYAAKRYRDSSPKTTARRSQGLTRKPTRGRLSAPSRLRKPDDADPESRNNSWQDPCSLLRRLSR